MSYESININDVDYSKRRYSNSVMNPQTSSNISIFNDMNVDSSDINVFANSNMPDFETYGMNRNIGTRVNPQVRIEANNDITETNGKLPETNKPNADSEQVDEVKEEGDPTGLRAEFEQIQKEQGIVGRTWDKVKNALPFLGNVGCKGSQEIEKIIQQAENGEITVEEAKEKIEKYKKNQEVGTEIALDTATFAIVSAVCLLAGPLGWSALAALGIATATGAVARVALGATEAATNEVEGDYTMEDVREDAETGMIIGFCRGMAKFFQIKVNKKKAKAVLDAAKQAEKATSVTKCLLAGVSSKFVTA